MYVHGACGGGANVCALLLFRRNFGERERERERERLGYEECTVDALFVSHSSSHVNM